MRTNRMKWLAGIFSVAAITVTIFIATADANAQDDQEDISIEVVDEAGLDLGDMDKADCKSMCSEMDCEGCSDEECAQCMKQCKSSCDSDSKKDCSGTTCDPGSKK